jgi:hypothetical protein
MATQSKSRLIIFNARTYTKLLAPSLATKDASLESNAARIRCSKDTSSRHEGSTPSQISFEGSWVG